MKTHALYLSLLVMAGCTKPKADQKAEGEKIMQLSREWAKAAASGDIEKTASYWADNAVLISAGEPVLTGRQSIREMVEASYKMPGFRISWQPRSVEVSQSGDMAYMLEDSQISYTDSTSKPVTHHNKAVSIWRKQADGNWKNAVDISTPAAQPGN